MLLKFLLKNNRFEFRLLQGQALEMFLDRGKEVDGVRYPTSYVAEQGEAWGMYHDGKLLGGYVIATQGPLRTMLGLKANGIEHSYSSNDVIELGGVWIEKDYRNKKNTTCIWLHMISRIKFYKRPYLIYGYNLQREGLKRMYSAGRPHVLFRGARTADGIKTHSTASIEVVRARTAVFVMQVLAAARILRSFAVRSSDSKVLSLAKDAELESFEAHRRVLSE
jgi:hypothetical protein